MKNSLSDLNNYMFEVLERLSDDELMAKDGDKEIERAKAMTSVASQIVATGNLTLNALKYQSEFDTSQLPGVLALPDSAKQKNGK